NSDECRKRMLFEVLNSRIQGRPSVNIKSLNLDRAWKKAWPKGLGIPNQRIPNRNPLNEPDIMEVSGQFEPLRPRAPAEILLYSAPNLQRLLDGFTGSLAASDIAKLKPHFLSPAKLRAAVERLSSGTVAPPFRRDAIIGQLMASVGRKLRLVD